MRAGASPGDEPLLRKPVGSGDETPRAGPRSGPGRGHRLGQEAAELSELGQRIEAAAERGDLIDYLDCDRQFHAEMVSTIGNPRLTDLVDRLRRQARLFGLQQLADTGMLLPSAQEHRAMIRMLQTGDVAASESLMTAHIGHTRGLWAGHPDKDIGRS